MLDINLIRNNKEEVRKSLLKRLSNFDLDEIIALDDKRKKLLAEVEQLKAEKNRNSKTKPTLEIIEKMRKIGENVKELDKQVREVKDKLQKKLHSLPNIPFEDVPIGDESNNIELRKVGKIPKFNFKVKDHLEIGETFDIIDVERAVKVSGARFAYLKREAVLLEFALIDLIIKKAVKKGFIPIIPPALIREGVVESLGYWDLGGHKDYYHVPNNTCPNCDEVMKETVIDVDGVERLKCHNCLYTARLTSFYLIGTAEHAIAPMHSQETFNEKELPKRYIGFSSAFRKEAGSYGKDTRGIIRVHQFDKVELFSFCHPEKSKEEHKFLIDFEESLWQELKIPYRVVQLASKDMSRPSASTVDIEAWMPGQNKYREVSSASNTTDFQARRLKIKYHKKGGGTGFVHMLNATGFPIGRTLIAILENYQNKDGSVKIPKVLQKYTDFKAIHPVKSREAGILPKAKLFNRVKR